MNEKHWEQENCIREGKEENAKRTKEQMEIMMYGSKRYDYMSSNEVFEEYRKKLGDPVPLYLLCNVK